MARTTITKEELKDWITDEIQKVEGCEGCTAGGIIALQEPDEGGCNWSDQITLTVTGIPPDLYQPVARRVITEARSRFNIE